MKILKQDNEIDPRWEILKNIKSEISEISKIPKQKTQET